MPYALLPQPKTITRDVLERGVRSSFPPGSFNFGEGSNLDAQVKWIADALLPVYQKIQELQDELNPGLTTEAGLLTDWERFTIHPECIDLEGLSVDARRALVVAALRGGQPGLTLAQLHTQITDTFSTLTFSQTTETGRLRIGGVRMGEAFLNNNVFVTVKPSSSTTDAEVTRIRCYVGTIVPNVVVYFVVKQT